MKHLTKFNEVKDEDFDEKSMEEKLLDMQLKLHGLTLTLAQRECVIGAMRDLVIEIKSKK